MIMNTLNVHKLCCQDSLSLCPDGKSRAMTLSVGLVTLSAGLVTLSAGLVTLSAGLVTLSVGLVTLSVGLEAQNPPGDHFIFLIPSLMKCTRSLTARNHKWLSWEKAIMDVHSKDSICTYALLSSFRVS